MKEEIEYQQEKLLFQKKRIKDQAIEIKEQEEAIAKLIERQQENED